MVRTGTSPVLRPKACWILLLLNFCRSSKRNFFACCCDACTYCLSVFFLRRANHRFRVQQPPVWCTSSPRKSLQPQPEKSPRPLPCTIDAARVHNLPARKVSNFGPKSFQLRPLPCTIDAVRVHNLPAGKSPTLARKVSNFWPEKSPTLAPKSLQLFAQNSLKYSPERFLGDQKVSNSGP